MTTENGTRAQNERLVEHGRDVAKRIEDAIHLNGEGAHAIRDLTDALANRLQSDVAMDLITDRFEKLAEQIDRLFQANLKLQTEMAANYRRSRKRENGE